MSMLRKQALLCSSPSSISKFHFSPVHLPYSRSSQAERERKMESVEFSFARHQGGFVDDGDDDVAWAVEKGSCFGGEEFLVDDFLDLGELETVGDEAQEEKEVENQEDEEEEKEEEEEEEAVAVAMREKNKSYCSSALTFEVPPPVSDFSLPAHDDVADLEWVSRVVDDSFSEVPTYVTHHQLQPQAMAQAPPPPLPPAVPVKARRSKRARTLSGSWSSSSYSSWDEGGPVVLLDSSAFSSTTTTAAASSATSSCSSSSYSSSQLFSAHQLFDEIPLHPSPPPPSKSPVLVNKKPKKRGRKPKVASADGITATAAANNGGGGERRCSHCGVNKTPQWRTGPMGAKSLCNACGVRYKSGRLLPEYRPACSPTFISHVHSNSHRKVLEMRRKEEEKMEKRQQHR